MNRENITFAPQREPHYKTKRYLLYLDTMRYYDIALKQWGELRVDKEGNFEGRALSHFFWYVIRLTHDDINKINEISLELELLDNDQVT